MKLKSKKIIASLLFVFFLLFEVVLISGLKTLQFNDVTKWIVGGGIHAAVLILLDYIFRIFYKKIYKKEYQHLAVLRFKNMYMEPHPYIPIVYKRGFKSQKSTPSRYPLNKHKKYLMPHLTPNNFRHIDGINGNRDIIVPKPKDQFRVLCLGASTTGNYINENGNVYSYPLELEKYLKRYDPDRDSIVHNCGHGGWMTAEILNNFLLNLYDTQPDAIVIHHAYNDLQASLTLNFQTDYSHCRKGLGETYYLYKLATFVPDIPLAIYNAALRLFFPFMNPRYNALQAISKGQINLKNDFCGISTYRRNIEHMIKICQSSNIRVILSTYPYYLYKDIKDSEIHLKYYQGVMLENEAMRSMAEDFKLPLVDNFNLIPREDKYFVDSVHYTPEGMRLIAENIGQVLCQDSPALLKKGINVN